MILPWEQAAICALPKLQKFEIHISILRISWGKNYSDSASYFSCSKPWNFRKAGRCSSYYIFITSLQFYSLHHSSQGRPGAYQTCDCMALRMIQRWDPLWGSRTARKRWDPPAVGQRHTGWQACEEGFEQGMMGTKWMIKWGSGGLGRQAKWAGWCEQEIIKPGRRGPPPRVWTQTSKCLHKSEVGEALTSLSENPHDRMPLWNACILKHVAWGGVLLQGYNLIGITGKRWYSSCDWRAPMDGYRLFRKDRLGQQGGERAAGRQSSA